MKYPMYVDFAIYPFCNLSCKFCYAEAKSDRNTIFQPQHLYL